MVENLIIDVVYAFSAYCTSNNNWDRFLEQLGKFFPDPQYVFWLSSFNINVSCAFLRSDGSIREWILKKSVNYCAHRRMVAGGGAACVVASCARLRAQQGRSTRLLRNERAISRIIFTKCVLLFIHCTIDKDNGQFY